jgi:hypothetical protein
MSDNEECPSKSYYDTEKTLNDEALHASICWDNAMGDFTNLPCYYVYRNIYTQLGSRKLSKSEMDLLGEIYSRSGRISSNPFVFRLLPKFQPADVVP